MIACVATLSSFAFYVFGSWKIYLRRRMDLFGFASLWKHLGYIKRVRSEARALTKLFGMFKGDQKCLRTTFEVDLQIS